MPFSNPILGGDFLVRPAMMSPNYVPGVSGWRIAKDGSVEFNNGVFRGSIIIGTNPGKHIVLANPATGDAVDVYDSSNALIYSIDANGVAKSTFQPGAQRTSSMSSGSIGMTYTSFPGGSMSMFVNAANSQFTGRQGSLFEIFVDGGDNGIPQFAVLGQSPPGTNFTSTVAAYERGQFGSVVTTDRLSDGNLFRMFHGTTSAINGGGGFIVADFTHGAFFTPTGAILIPFDGPSVTNTFTYNVESMTSSTVRVSLRHTDGTAVTVGEATECFGIVWG